MRLPSGLLVLLLLLGQTAQAQEANLADEAELHFQQGVEAFLARRYTEALEHLMLSNRLSPNPSVSYNIGRTYEMLGDVARAYTYYRAAAETWESPERREQAQQAIESLRPRLALVEITSDPPGAAVFLDRVNLGQRGTTPLTLAVEPGAHDILLRLEGYAPARLGGLEALRGATAPAQVTLEAIPGNVELTGGPAGAEVRLGGPDGPLVGTVPTTLSLPVGQRDLYISAPVHLPSYQQVTVTEAGTTRVAVELTLITGALVVDATEAGALIEVDGAAVGFTPAMVRVSAGEHLVRISAPGYQPHEVALDIPADAEVVVSPSLLPRQEVTAASRRAEAISEAPASVSVISAQEIRAFGYQSVWEAVGTVRGAYQTDDLTYRFLGLRGLSIAGDYGNRILLTLDGHSYNDDLIGASYPDEAMMVDLEGVSRIEVLRGPGSALYGSNAFFGVVNVVTGDREERPRDSASVAAVRDGYARARVAGGVGDATRGAWASAAGAFSQGQDYTFPELDDGSGSGGQAIDNDALKGATAMARAWAGDLELQAHASLRDKQIPTASFETLLDDDRARSRDARAFIEARYAPALGDRLRLLSRAYVDRYTFQGIFPYATEDGGLAEETWEGLWVGAEPRLLWSLGERTDLTLGAEARIQLQGTLTGTRAAEAEAYLSETLLPRVFSGYAEVDTALAPWLNLIAGGRLDQFSTFGLAGSPRLAMVLQPGPQDTLKLLGGRAFRAPSVYELTYSDGGVTQTQATDLGAETILTAEAEYTHRFAEVVTASADVFFNQFSGLIDTYLDDDGVFVYANGDEVAHAAGAELEVLRDWRGGWMAGASYSFQRTRYGALLEDSIPTNSPAHRAVLKAAGPPGPGGTQLATLLRAESGRLTPADTWTDPALLWDVTASGRLRGGAARWAFGVRNALDWDYAHPGGYDLRQSAVPQPGRSLFLELGYDR